MPAQAELANHFTREGYVIARDVMTLDDAAPLVRDLEHFLSRRARELQAAGKIRDLHASLDFEHRVVALYRQSPAILAGMDIMLIRGPGMFAFLNNAHLLDLIEVFIGPEISCNPIQHVRAKMPADVDPNNGFMNVPWHQDVGVTHPDSDPSTIITFWIPLVHATRETGCMEVLPRCVELGMLPHVTGNYGTEIDPAALPDREPVAAECPRGGVVVMSKYTPHRGTPNASAIARWSIDLRYHVSGQHSGRVSQPEFVVRSRRNPDAVQRDYGAWCTAWEDALANPRPGAVHRVKA